MHKFNSKWTKNLILRPDTQNLIDILSCAFWMHLLLIPVTTHVCNAHSCVHMQRPSQESRCPSHHSWYKVTHWKRSLQVWLNWLSIELMGCLSPLLSTQVIDVWTIPRFYMCGVYPFVQAGLAWVSSSSLIYGKYCSNIWIKMFPFRCVTMYSSKYFWIFLWDVVNFK